MDIWPDVEHFCLFARHSLWNIDYVDKLREDLPNQKCIFLNIALWVKASSGVKKGPKNVKSRPLFLIHQTHQVIFAALYELVMTHILHRKKLDDVGAEYLTKITANVQKSWSRPQ